MASKKVKVVNLLDCQININLSALNGKTIPIMPRGFAYLNEDELAYVTNTSTAFAKGSLRVEGELPENLEVPTSPNAMTVEEMEKFLKQKQKAIREQVVEIDAPHVIKKMIEIAHQNDMSVRVIEILTSRLEELQQ